MDNESRWDQFAFKALRQERDALRVECDAITELNFAQWLALENVRLLAARYHNEEWASHMLRFIENAGTNKAQITRRQVNNALAKPAPSIPEGWLRAIDEALVVAHIGVANESDTYEQAKAKLVSLIGFHVDVASDPAVNGGWKLVPTAESRHPGIYKMLSVLHAVYNTPGASEWESYAAMLAAAPEAKP